MTRDPLATGEFYHIYNRGVDKREIFKDQKDVRRFMDSIEIFNSIKPIGSIHEQDFRDRKNHKTKKLVNIVCFCINPNHYHFILEQVVDGGIAEFMKRVNGGYTWYFNKRHDRSGSLFQGTYKSVHIDTDEYLLHLSAYVNLNNRAHKLGGLTAKFVRSSWGEFIKDVEKPICHNKAIILGQFKNKEAYAKFALSSLEDIIERKEDDLELSSLCLE